MRRVALVALAALLAGCGSTVPVSGTATTAGDQLGQGLTPTAVGGTSAPGAVVPGGPQALGPAGVTQQPDVTSTLPGGTPGSTRAPSARITTPIQIGFMSTKVSNANSLGINAGQTYGDEQAYDALVKEYNAHGGLAGRKIVPVYGETDTASTDWSTQFHAACEDLTRDHHVEAVLGYVFVFLDSFEQCLASRHIPHLYGGYQPGDVQAQRDFPNVVSVAHPTVDGLNETVLSGAMTAGLLTTRSKLGIVYDGCAHGDRAFAKSTEPWLKAHHLQYEAVYIDCAGGSADAGPAATAVKSAQLQFAAHRVDVVFVPNAIELLLFMENAQSQGYRPTYINQGGGAAFEAQGRAVPQEQEKRLHGFGWSPALDVTQSHQPYARTPQQRACLDKLKRHGLVPQAYNDFMFAFITCDSLDLYARALTLTGGVSDGAQVQQALLAVMPRFQGSFTYAGAYGVSSAQRGGPGRYRATAWDDACTCFTYRGPVRRVPTV
jgi:hypothetical protein